MNRIVKVHIAHGVAGQVAITVGVDHGPDFGGIDDVTFVGSAFGTPGPIVLVSHAFGQTFVTNPGRFGETFGEDWVRRFYA